MRPEELAEWNEIAQWCSAHPMYFLAPLPASEPSFPASMLGRLLEEYARLRVEVEELRAQLAEISDDTQALQRENRGAR
jgi:hypothetical protein